jgi:hypothetical protein
VEALEALANQQNPDTPLLFRYLTTAVIGVETGWTGAEPAIATWQAIREGEYGEQYRSEAVERLRSFLAQLPRPARIGESSWELLQAAVAEEAAFFRLIMGFEWAVGQPGLDQTEAQIRSILLRRGYASDEGQASLLYEHLVAYVFRRLSKRGRAPLTAAGLADACAQRTRSAKDDELIALIHADIAQTNARLEHVESAVAGYSTKLTALQQTIQRMNGAVPRPGRLGLHVNRAGADLPGRGRSPQQAGRPGIIANYGARPAGTGAHHPDDSGHRPL